MERCFDRQNLEFENEYCKFKPYDWEEIEGVLRPTLFKVVTSDLKSLGLRNNTNIMEFMVGQWVKLPSDQIQIGKSDWGRIWSALKFSGAKTLEKYMFEKYRVSTRTFLAASDTPLYANSYRIKSQGVMLLEEI